jgi:hypothetical protein
MLKRLLVALILCLLLTPLVLNGCGPREEGFAIYLTKDNVPPSEMAQSGNVTLADEPLFSTVDIVSYERDTNIITLKPAAYATVDALQVPVTGLSFVVCVDKAPVYWGAFWSPESSQSFDGVIIWTLAYDSTKTDVRLELGYPSPDYFHGADPRSNPEIITALEKAGKLK